MGKKVKIGKQRRDKFYHLAKEAGFRSRAAFKLIQLNKRFEFLQSAKAVVDLCAAPGGWMQVAKQNMPVASLCIGVDLVPIKPIHGCISLQGDITEESTRQAIKKELKGFPCDTVLHDGAPNVGMNWIHDAFQQNCLTLMALKMATQILRKNGTFVTKVFRSNDYHYLITVFEKLFKKVHVWKPAASRLESAEIFVVCEKYFKPAKVDPDLLNVKKVFLEADLDPKLPNSQTILLNKKQKKAKAEGYADSAALSLHSTTDATKFIESHNYLDILAQSNAITLDQERWADSAETTDEIRECLKDIKLCGPRELRILLKWRKKMRALLEKEAEEAENDLEPMEQDEPSLTAEEAEDRELAEIDVQIAQASADEKAALKKKKKKMLREKARTLKRKQLKMIHEDDPGLVEEMPDLFSLKNIKKANLALVSSEASVPNFDMNDDNSDIDEFGFGDRKRETKEQDSNSENDDDDDDPFEGNALLHTNDSYLDLEQRKAKRADEWFSKNAISDLVSSDDDDDDIGVIEKHIKKTKNAVMANTVSFEDKKKVKDVDDDAEFNGESADLFNEEIESDEEEKYEDEDKRIAKRKAEENVTKTSGKKRRLLTPEELALGEQLIYSSKSRKDLEEWGWHRYANNDEGLPDWFVEDEKKHYQKTPPVTKEAVQRYKERMKEMNVRPIKKVAEAKARKAKRVARRLEKAKKKAEAIVENENLEHTEKVREMKKVYRQAHKKEDKKPNVVVVTKGNRGRMGRPGGRYKTVDRRMKTELRAKKAADKRAGKKTGRGKKRR